MKSAVVTILILLALAGPSVAGAVVLVGTSGSDTLIGTGARDWINGRGGNDTLRGRGNDDTLIGSKGNDTEFGGYGEDFHYGGGGNDTLYALARDGDVDHFDAGGGVDKCIFRGTVTLKGCEIIEER